MNFIDCLEKQLHMHPHLQARDVIKMCYQAAFGAEHLLADLEKARKYFDEEYERVDVAKADEPLYERISEDICRMNMRAWKASGMPSEWLFRMFIQTASANGMDKEAKEGKFLEYLNVAMNHPGLTLRIPDLKVYITRYLDEGIRALHHSDLYREHEAPAYRIVKSSLVRLLPVLEQAVKVKKDGVTVIAIDGRAASGKTTMSNELKEILGVDVIRMDDFFVPPALRNAQRFAEPGNNIHYERYMEEVLPYINQPEAFSYRIFDCSIMDYNGEQMITDSCWRLVEGAYSTHPRFGNYADVKVFFDIGKEEQMARILRRNGEAMAKMFEERWIPMEEAYYETFNIQQNADIVIGQSTDLRK